MEASKVKDFVNSMNSFVDKNPGQEENPKIKKLANDYKEICDNKFANLLEGKKIIREGIEEIIVSVKPMFKMNNNFPLLVPTYDVMIKGISYVGKGLLKGVTIERLNDLREKLVHESNA